ncbi:hypothetical protein PRK78_005749 [Emydomyces testavorans]|uniref:Thioesterase domain-containing protein n=1 Tax=Emydomyces testavorans TaxID=2070801 RepID=A0AAF0DK70_9EURO|nr:hypothetical protein PRK78_005749 [Emydomyces testavorans]
MPWCSALLSDPRYAITSTESRTPKATTEDALFAETLNTAKTISACLSFYKKPANPREPIAEVRTLLSIESGLNGYPHVCHGGIIATVLDEGMGLLLSLNKDREEEAARASGRSVQRPATVTAELTVRYLKPVVTPQTICVIVELARVQGRKIWLQGTIKDYLGTAMVKAEGVFVQTGREISDSILAVEFLRNGEFRSTRIDYFDSDDVEQYHALLFGSGDNSSVSAKLLIAENVSSEAIEVLSIRFSLNLRLFYYHLEFNIRRSVMRNLVSASLEVAISVTWCMSSHVPDKYIRILIPCNLKPTGERKLDTRLAQGLDLLKANLLHESHRLKAKRALQRLRLIFPKTDMETG